MTVILILVLMVLLGIFHPKVVVVLAEVEAQEEITANLLLIHLIMTFKLIANVKLLAFTKTKGYKKASMQHVIFYEVGKGLLVEQ